MNAKPRIFRPLIFPRVKLAAMIAAACGLTACNNDNPGDMANERLAITNNLITLDQRVSYTEQLLEIDTAGAGLPRPAAARVANSKTNGTIQFLSAPLKAGNLAKNASLPLRLVAEVEPPVVEGEVVQATAVSMVKKDTVVVSYNMRGAPRLGAIDLFRYKKGSSPRLLSSVTFNDTDINSVSVDDKYVYASGATDSPDFTFPAVLEKIKVKKGKWLILSDNNRVQLSSYAGTSAERAGDIIFATSGDGGELAAFNRSKKSFEKLTGFSLDDARWVSWDEKGDRVLVAQGTPGRISVFDENLQADGSLLLLNTFPFPGANVAESKSTVEAAGNKAFIAAGPEGVQIMCLTDGQILGNVPIPDAASLGLDPSVVVTNSVTIDDDLMFISNGEAGVYVAQASRKFKDTGCSEPMSITMLGKLRFGNLQSANHVAYKGKYLIVAAGLGGIKVVRVEVDDD